MPMHYRAWFTASAKTTAPSHCAVTHSAMVVASALVTAHALGLQLTRGALASLSARAEQYIGVMSGGMDQTASSVSEAGNALHIEVQLTNSITDSYLQ
jgi:galactokinase